jgi:hypothetical protein
MQFDWDPKKAKSNLAKHGVSFERASLVFSDPLALIEDDADASEERWRMTGMADRVLLRVVYTEREGDNGGLVFRIISARRTTQAERRRYESEI